MTMNALQILLLTTLVLRSGDRIAVDEPPREQNGRVVFRSGGVLYSLPATEVDLVTTRANDVAATTEEAKTAETKRRLAVSEEERKRLIAKVEKTRGGTPSDERQRSSAERFAPPPTRAETEQQTRDEWSWRREARAHEESIRRAKEEVALLEERIAQLRREIHAFLNLGYKPRQFTYQTTELAHAQEQLPRAELEVRRAERAYEQFRDDARRMGVMPGWLR
jgi:hypothetical protein